MNNIIGSVKNGIDKIHYAWKDFPIDYNKAIAYYPAPNKKVAPKRDEHAALYIGKMTKGEDGIYTREALEGMIQCAASQNYTNGDRIQIYLCSILYESLADKNNKKDILTFEEQRKRLYTMIKELHLPGHAQNYVEVNNMYNSHKELFDAIKDKGLSGVEGYMNKDRQNNESTNSFEIAKFLYYLCETYPEIKKTFLSLVPAELQSQLDNNSALQYYGLLEIACRITDLINGITLQGGFVRQKKYDNIISRLVSGNTGLQEIDKYFKIMGENKDLNLSKWYFENSSYRGLMKQKNKQDKERGKIKKRILRNTGITAGLVAAALTGSILTNTYNKLQKEKAEQELFDKVFKEKGKRNIYGYVDILEPKDALQEWNGAIDRARGAIQERYNIDEETSSLAKAAIGDCFLQDTSSVDIFMNAYEGDLATEQQQRNAYIDSQIIGKHPYMRQKLGVKGKPYEYLDYMLPAFLNTVLANGNFDGMTDGHTKSGDVTGIEYSDKDAKIRIPHMIRRFSYLGEYYIEDIGYYHLQSVDGVDPETPRYFIAKSFAGEEKYNLVLSKKASLKLLYERFPNIQKCVQEYIQFYKDSVSNSLTNTLTKGTMFSHIYGDKRDELVEKILRTLCKEYHIPLLPQADTENHRAFFSALDKPFSPEFIHNIVIKIGI